MTQINETNTDNLDRGPRGFVVKMLALAGLLGAVGLIVAIGLSGDPVDQYEGMLTQRVSRGSFRVSITEQGILESAENYEYKSKVRGRNAVLWIIESGSLVEKGDELVRLDSLAIQEQIDERTKYSNWSQSGADRSKAELAKKKIAVDEYKEGRFKAAQLRLQKQISISEGNLQNAEDQLRYSKMMAKSGYLNETRLEETEFMVSQAKAQYDLNKTNQSVLENFTYKEQLQTLIGDLASEEAKHKANVERAMADASRRDRAILELGYCVIKADRSGMVIHPNAAKWETAPIAEGTNVYKDQVLLLMPDLQQMQVKIGVHESSVKRVSVGQKADVMLGGRLVKGEVAEVASITKPAGWWTGNQVRYDTLISLPYAENHLPGMSAEVEVTVAEYRDVLQIPVAAVVDTPNGVFCWVKTTGGPKRVQIQIGDSNESFHLVESGLEEGAEVYMNTFAFESLSGQIEKSTGETGATEEPESMNQESAGNRSAQVDTK